MGTLIAMGVLGTELPKIGLSLQENFSTLCAWEHLRTVSMIAATVENCIDFECLGIQYLGDNDIDFDLLFRIGDDIVYLDVYSGG